MSLLAQQFARVVTTVRALRQAAGKALARNQAEPSRMKAFARSSRVGPRLQAASRAPNQRKLAPPRR